MQPKITPGSDSLEAWTAALAGKDVPTNAAMSADARALGNAWRHDADRFEAKEATEAEVARFVEALSTLHASQAGSRSALWTRFFASLPPMPVRFAAAGLVAIAAAITWRYDAIHADQGIDVLSRGAMAQRTLLTDDPRQFAERFSVELRRTDAHVRSILVSKEVVQVEVSILDTQINAVNTVLTQYELRPATAGERVFVVSVRERQ
jgi:hypothetical protein